MLHASMGDDRRHIRYEYTRFPVEITCPFVLKSMGQFFCDDRYFTVRDGLEECILIYTLSGTGMVQYGQQCREVSSGDFIVLDCREYHDYRTKAGGEWGFFWVHFAGSAAFDYTALINKGGFACTHMGKEQFAHYSRQFVALVEQKEQIAALGINQLLTQLLTKAVYLQNECRIQESASSRVAVSRAVALIERQYSSPISLAQMAGQAMLSRYYFIKIFKEIMGLTPHRFLLQTRVNEAKKLLVGTDLSVQEIAEQCGFCDVKNMILHFKAIVGTTPFQFRRQETRWNPQ